MEKKIKVFEEQRLRITGTPTKKQLAQLVSDLYGAESSLIKLEQRGDHHDLTIMRYVASHLLDEEVPV